MITDVYCYYTGGGIYIYSAKYNDVYLYGSLDQVLECYRHRGEVLWQDESVCEYFGWLDEMKEFSHVTDPYDYYVSPEEIEYPTWQEILDSLRNATELSIEADDNLRYWNPDLTLKVNDERKEDLHDENRC